MQNKTLPITNLGDKWLEYFKSIDCKYVVINLKDMIEALSDEELIDFNNMLQSYNQYREEVKKKEISKYFCVKRDDFPAFKDRPAIDFWDWVHKVYNYTYGEE